MDLPPTHPFIIKMVRDTSLIAYRILEKGLLQKCQEIVYRYIQNHPLCCDREIAEATKLNINNVTGRRNALVKLGLIKDNGKKPDLKTCREVHCWKVEKNPDVRIIQNKIVPIQSRLFLFL